MFKTLRRVALASLKILASRCWMCTGFIPGLLSSTPGVQAFTYCCMAVLPVIVIAEATIRVRCSVR